MAVVFMDGFDHLAGTDITLKWDSSSTITGSSKVTGAFGFGSAQRSNGSGRIAQRTVPSAATYILALHFRTDGLPGSDVFIARFRESTTVHTDIRLAADGALRATRNGTSLGISAAGVIAANTWYWLAIKTTINNTTGVVTIYVNNVSVLALTSQDTQNAGTAACDNIQLGSVGAGLNTDWDNVVILDTTGSAPLNDIPTEEWRIDTRSATGAGNSTQFTASTGSNWQNVDDATQDGDSTYNSSSTAGHIDLFAIQDFDAGVVRAVQVNMVARRDDAGPRDIREKCRSASANYSGTTQTVTSAYLNYRQIRETDPATAAAWTAANLNAAEFGYELVT